MGRNSPGTTMAEQPIPQDRTHEDTGDVEADLFAQRVVPITKDARFLHRQTSGCKDYPLGGLTIGTPWGNKEGDWEYMVEAAEVELEPRCGRPSPQAKS
jgi:hypothetical protein